MRSRASEIASIIAVARALSAPSGHTKRGPCFAFFALVAIELPGPEADRHHRIGHRHRRRVSTRTSTCPPAASRREPAEIPQGRCGRNDQHRARRLAVASRQHDDIAGATRHAQSSRSSRAVPRTVLSARPPTSIAQQTAREAKKKSGRRRAATWPCSPICNSLVRDCRSNCDGWQGGRMADFTLVVGNKNYSSWSMRGGLMVRIAGIDVRGDRDSARPARDAGRDPQALALGPGAGAAASRPRRLGFARHRGISQRPQARGRFLAGAVGRGARSCTLDLDRDARGLHGPAQQHADEHPRLLSRQGHDARRPRRHRDESPRSGATAASALPARLPRTMASCSALRRRRCHVCAGGHPLHAPTA